MLSIENSSLTEFFNMVSLRLPQESLRILEVLFTEGKMNKEELSLTAKVKRAVLDHDLMQLFALCLVDIDTEGKSKICCITELGQDYLSFYKEKLPA